MRASSKINENLYYFRLKFRFLFKKEHNSYFDSHFFTFKEQYLRTIEILQHLSQSLINKQLNVNEFVEYLFIVKK